MRGFTLSTLAVVAAATMALNACGSDMPTGPDAGAIAAAKGGNGHHVGGSGGGKNGKPDPNRIVFVRRTVVGSTPDIFTINPDGTGVVQLTSTEIGYGGNYSPHWTADHSKIVFISERTGMGEVFIMNFDGTGVKQLTSDGTRKRDAVPSPDGTRIVFRRVDAQGGLFVMNIDGTNVQRLTSYNADMQPAWWPGQNKIMFAAKRGQDTVYQVWAMNVDGTGQAKLTSCGGGCQGPALSPDGTHVALWYPAGGIGRIMIYNVAFNSGWVAATGLGTSYDNPATWSPDGTRLAYNRTTYGYTTVYTANIDGTGETQLYSYGSATYMEPSWYR